jgi:hypothetical protein
MANEEQLSILKQGVRAWHEWRRNNPDAEVDLNNAELWDAELQFVDLSDAKLLKATLSGAHLFGANLTRANLGEANLSAAFIRTAKLYDANLSQVNLSDADLLKAELNKANLNGADLRGADLSMVNLTNANLAGANLYRANLRGANLLGSNFTKANVGDTIFGDSDLSQVIGLDKVRHEGPANISTNVLALSKGRIPEKFLRGCGLSDWEIEATKLFNPELTNDEITKIQYFIYELRATQAIQISPLFISYSHGNGEFVDKLEKHLNKKGVRFWRDIHDMKSGRMETQIDRAMHLNPTVLLVLSEHSLQSDWVEHEVRTARALEKEMKKDVLCPVALDDCWKNSPWAKRIMEQILEYNILDFSEWKDDAKFRTTFTKLIDGLELFYK